jgi:RNA polymerase sigma-70 factor, ECF subfamily
LSILVADRDLLHASDADLVDAIADGNDAALHEVYRRHAGVVRGVARRPLVSADLAEEAVQDAFLQLWTCPERFDADRGSLRSYLQVQAYRRAVDLSRAETARRCREQQDAHRSPPRTLGPEDEVIDLAAARQVRRAVAGLAPQERQAIELAYFAGHSYRQVAALLGQPEGTVKNRIRAGLRRLRSLLPAMTAPAGAMSEIPFA